MVTNSLQPERVFYYFEEICAIPHPSYQLDAIDDYLVSFAKEHGLPYRTDAQGNVIIIKNASEGYERQPSVMLQGHIDMVAVKTGDSDVDPEVEGLQLEIEDGYLYANGTSLGGDDGIAVAIILAILESDTIAHPRIEAIFTANEEVGMEGALGIDMSDLHARRLLNIDSEEEGVLIAGCAGGVRVRSILPIKREEVSGKKLQIHVDGLLGGHSGTEIDKERGNSNCLMGRILTSITGDALLVELNGGLKDNAIPRVTSAILLVNSEDAQERIENVLRKMRIEFLKEFWGRDDGINITWAWTLDTTMEALTKESTKKVANFLVASPNGVVRMSENLPQLVETSLNMGIVRLTEQELHVDFALRSCVATEKEKLKNKVKELTKFFGGKTEESGDYPEWAYREQSSLRDKMVRIYREYFEEEPEVTIIHAGLECGILLSKCPDLDCISFGPDILDIHTTEEKLNIASTERVWNYLLKVLADRDEDLMQPEEYDDFMSDNNTFDDVLAGEWISEEDYVREGEEERYMREVDEDLEEAFADVAEEVVLTEEMPEEELPEEEMPEEELPEEEVPEEATEEIHFPEWMNPYI